MFGSILLTDRTIEQLLDIPVELLALLTTHLPERLQHLRRVFPIPAPEALGFRSHLRMKPRTPTEHTDRHTKVLLQGGGNMIGVCWNHK